MSLHTKAVLSHCNKYLSVMASVAVIAGVSDTLASESDFYIEEIVVTATKRSQSIQDVPAAVSQVSGDALEERGISNIENLALQVPNLQFGSTGSNTFITIRGIGTTVDSGVAEPAVATYIDGVFLPRASMGTLDAIDLERAEVMRGPQGTLYGRNATGGSINFVSRAPAEEFEGGIKVTLENRDGYGISGFVSGPISDSVFYRLSAGKAEQDGYVEVVNTGEDIAGNDKERVRGALQFRPTDQLTVDLSVQYEKNDAAVGFQQLLTRSHVVDALYGAENNNQTTDVNKVYGDEKGLFKGENETTIVSSVVNWDMSDAVSFRSVTGYVDHEIVTFYDADATDAFFTRLVDTYRPSESFSQEFNFYGEVGDLSWLVGAFYFQEDFELHLEVDFLSTALGVPGPAFPVNVVAGDLVEDTRSFALFTDLTYALSDQLRLNVGLRYNEEEKEFTFLGAPSQSGDIDTDDLLPKIGLQYDINNEINVYAQYQQGIKSGGHQLSSPALFEPEKLDSYEFGIKSQVLDGRLIANAAAFYYDYSDLQATTTIPPATTLVRNSDAEVLGAELEVYYYPSESWNINLGLSFLDSEYKDFGFFDTFSGETADLDGEDLIRAPAFTMNFGAEWILPIDGKLISELKIRGDLYYSDDYKLTFIDYDQTRQDSYTTGNLAVILTGASEAVMVRAFVDNIADEEVLNNGTYLATSTAFSGYYSEPRTYGVEMSYNF